VPRHVDARRDRRLHLGHIDHSADDGGRSEQNVDVHAPTPRQVLREDASQDEPDRTATDRDRAKDPEGLAAVLWVAERRHQCSECGRCEHRAGRTLEGSGDDQNRERRGGAAEGRRRSKGHKRDQERPFAPEYVADPTPKEQQTPEGQRVGRDDPLSLAVVETEGSLCRRQSDIHDCRVKHDHQLGN
jgi:hypothetical protein